MREEAIRIWGEDHLGQLTTKVGKLVHDCAAAKDFSRLDPLCQYFRYRVARSGQGILEITGGTGRCFADELCPYELQGLPLEDLWGMLLMPTPPTSHGDRHHRVGWNDRSIRLYIKSSTSCSSFAYNESERSGPRAEGPPGPPYLG